MSGPRRTRPYWRYTSVCELHHWARTLADRSAEFENAIPYSLRFRAALLARPSRYSDPAEAIRESPEESRRDVQRTLQVSGTCEVEPAIMLTPQQYTLALNICEVMMSLHRPYYVHALHEPVADPTLSVYGQSYLTIVERCNVSSVVSTVQLTLADDRSHDGESARSAPKRLRSALVHLGKSDLATTLTAVPPLHSRGVCRDAGHRESA